MSITSLFNLSATRATLSLTLSISAFSGTALAEQCGDISPLLAAMGDAYYDVDFTGKYQELEPVEFENADLPLTQLPESEVTDTERRDTDPQSELQQTELFIALRDTHFKGGTGERTRCFGTEYNGRVETSMVELTDIRQIDRGNRLFSELVIEVQEYEKAQRLLRRESLYLSLAEHTDVAATSDGESVIVNTRRRQATEVGSYLRETAIGATLTKRGVDISQSLYVNGHLAEWFSWSLNTRD